MNKTEPQIDAAMVGKMFVTRVCFQFHESTSRWDGDKQIAIPSHWDIEAGLNDKPSSSYPTTSMSFRVEQGIGQKLAEVLLPVVIADASRKAQQLADDSKAMLDALGTRAVACIADMDKPSRA